MEDAQTYPCIICIRQACPAPTVGRCSVDFQAFTDFPQRQVCCLACQMFGLCLTAPSREEVVVTIWRPPIDRFPHCTSGTNFCCQAVIDRNFPRFLLALDDAFRQHDASGCDVFKFQAKHFTYSSSGRSRKTKDRP